MRAPQVFIETFGCQMNEYDTEVVRSILKARGYGFTDSADSADVVLLNTCAIREKAHNKVYGHLGLLKPLKEERPCDRCAGLHGAKPQEGPPGE